MTPFGQMLETYISSAGLTKMAFAELVKRSSGWMTLVTQGTAVPRLDELPAWADALGLEGEDREVFIHHGEMAKLSNKQDLQPYIDKFMQHEQFSSRIIIEFADFLELARNLETLADLEELKRVAEITLKTLKESGIQRRARTKLMGYEQAAAGAARAAEAAQKYHATKPSPPLDRQ